MAENKKMVLTEFYQLCPNGQCDDLLTEDDKRMIKDGHMILTGKIQGANEINGNGRVYPRKVLEREVEKYQQLINENRSLGCLDHGSDEVVSLNTASHIIIKIWWNNNDVMGKLKVLGTPSGQILKTLVKEGVMLGISSRALGSVMESNGKTIVGEDLQIISWDIVSNPSSKNAFLHLSEQKRLMKENKKQKINIIISEILREK